MPTDLPIPPWLENLTPAEIENAPLPCERLLAHSLFYANCGTDGTPVRHLAYLTPSLVYADYGLVRDEVIAELERWRPATKNQPGGRCFQGYDLVGLRSLESEELAPGGWTEPEWRRGDGNPWRFKDWRKPFFGVWAIYERLPDVDHNHGPPRFSLLQICQESCTTYRTLYYSARTTAQVITIIRQGSGYGCGFTDLRHPKLVFARTVMGNPYGQPVFLIWDGWDKDENYTACWPWFRYPVRRLESWRNLGLWSR